MILTADDSREMSYLQTAGKADGVRHGAAFLQDLCGASHSSLPEGGGVAEGDPHFLQMDFDS
jgi:hypothetical protein